jgi:hypothetical protein
MIYFDSMKNRIVLVAFGWMLVGCAVQNEVLDKGLVRISLDLPSITNNVRTLHPDLTGLSYTLHFTSTGASHEDEAITPGTAHVVTLETGAWKIEVFGFSGETKKAAGQANVTVTAQQTQDLVISLEPVAEGTGKLAYQVTLPTNVTGTLTVCPPRQPASPVSTTGNPASLNSGANTGEISLLPGVYLLSLEAQPANTADYADLIDIIHIYRDTTTSFTHNPQAPIIPDPDKVVDKLDLTGRFAVPVRGGVAVSSSFDGDGQYSGVVTWQDMSGAAFAGVYAASTVYKALVKISPADGYTLDGLSADSFIYNGASSVTYDAGTQTVTVVFPSTEAPPPETGAVNITITYWYGDIAISGNSGTNTIKKSGTPDSISFTAPSDYEDIIWYFGIVKVGTGSSLTIHAKDYDSGDHSITFTGRKQGTATYYSQRLSLTIAPGQVTYTVSQPSGTSKLKFIFSESITDFTADQVLLFDNGGKATKGAVDDCGDSDGTTWQLAITVQTAGTIGVLVTREGVTGSLVNLTVTGP